MVADAGAKDAAAIASARAGEVFGLVPLASSIQDFDDNITRFIVIGRRPLKNSVPDKTTIVFSVPNEPGALFKALSVFALRDIDLTKIESRPIPGKPWEYLFYLDFAGSATEERGLRALQHLAEIATYLRVFGSYPRAENKAGSPAAPGDARRWKENVRWEWNQNSRG